MKFLCIPCDAVMEFAERQLPGDGTMAAVFTCPSCGHEVAMLANPMETQFVSSLGIRVGGRTVPAQPLELTRGAMLEGRPEAFDDTDAPADESGRPAAPGGARPAVRWSEDARERLGHVPVFVRGMVKRIYTDYAKDHGLPEITPAVMDRARTELGLEGM